MTAAIALLGGGGRGEEERAAGNRLERCENTRACTHRHTHTHLRVRREREGEGDRRAVEVGESKTHRKG